jgi:hypothetical protein
MDLNEWSDSDLRRYRYLLWKLRDGEIFSECGLSPAEMRELEVSALASHPNAHLTTRYRSSG